ncbi:MAG: response regulator, partial [Chthoniobacteraceae bacterium]|nr:response regulator [Chthoniobacteraceae bacterium]
MKILIVDDEPGLASGLAQWLVENGWDTPGVAVSSGEAMEWANQNGRVDVLVSDVVLPESDGFTLRETLVARFPKMKTIFISGYDLSEHAGRMEGGLFLPKPVTGEALDDAIRRLFEPVAEPPHQAPEAVPIVPQAVAETAAAPRPVAVAVTAPKAVAVAKAAAPRVAVSPPKASPAPKVVPAAAPKATPVSASKAAPRPVPAAAPKTAHPPGPLHVAVPGSEKELPPDELVGTTVGNYRIEARIGQASQGPIYRALQTNMARQ